MNAKHLFILTTILLFITSAQSLPAQKIRVLFDGKSNRNWVTTGNVTTEDGILTLTGQQARAILDERNYKDFDLSLDLRTTTGGKGAIAFHTDRTGKGYKVSLNNDPTDPVTWHMTGSLLSVRNLSQSFVQENEWFKMNIRVEGKAITITINGTPVVEYIEPAVPYRTPENANELLSQGTFFLISTGSGSLQFRNITILQIDPKGIDVSAQLAKAIDEQTDPIIRQNQEDRGPIR